MREAAKLYQLQTMDLDIEEKRRTISHLMQQEREDVVLQTAQAQLRAAEKVADDLRQRAARLEKELAGKTAKIADLEKHLFGGGVGKQKEAGALERELDTLRGLRARMEDELLDVMDEIDHQPPKLAAARTDFEHTERAQAAKRAAWKAEIDRLEVSVHAAEQVRQALAQEVSADVLRTYQELRQRCGGRAVARVERSTCLGCRVALPMGEVQRARSKPALSFCSFCGRIIFLDR